MGDDPSPAVAHRALTHLGNLLHGLDPNLAAPGSTADPLAAACYHCHSLFTPPRPVCPICLRPSTLGLPGPDPDLVHAGHLLSDRLRRYKGLPFLALLPAPINVLICLVLRSWLRTLHHHQRRWTDLTLPSAPLLSGGRVLCLWNWVDPDSLLPLPAGTYWRYIDHEDFSSLQAAPLPPPLACPSTPWLLSPTCSTCGRPQPLHASVLWTPTDGFLSSPGYCCWSTPPGTPLTSRAASRSCVSIGASPLLGVLPVSTLRRSECSPPTPPPTTPLSRLLLRHLPPPRPLPATGGGPPEPLRLLSLNCGGASDKLPRLIALMVHTDPDIVCLQEAAGFTPAHFHGLAYQSWHGPPVRGGGLITLIHPRRLHGVHHSQPPILDPHALVVTVPLSPRASLCIANLHLPPRLPSEQRRAACSLAATALQRAPPGVRLLAGDLNDTLGNRSSWLQRELGPRGVWTGW